MIITFFRRWWVTNRLYHFCKKRFRACAPEDDFADWMVGLDISSRMAQWYLDALPSSSYIHSHIRDILLTSKIIDLQRTELKRIITECRHIGWISNPAHEIEVSPSGLEKYSVSYLIFGHDYARKIWTAVIAGLVIWYLTDRVKDIVPPTIEVKYILPTQEILQPVQK